MKAVIQKVSKASVTGSINKGLCVLVGITHKDTQTDIDYIVKKILNLKVFEDEAGVFWKKSVKELDLEVLSVSQFTLYAETRKGNKPDFHNAMKSDTSKDVYNQFLKTLKAEYKEDKIQDGEFGAMMAVDIQNDGPVTIQIDSKKFKYED